MKRTRQKKHRTAKPVLRYSRLRGTLSWGNHELPFRGAIAITADGTIGFTTTRFRLTEKTAWILELVPGKGRLATWAKLRARTLDGLELESDYVTMTGRTGMMALKGQLSRLTVHHTPPPAVAANCLLVYHTLGMRGFSVQNSSTTLGLIRLAGESDVDDYDHLAGEIQITSYAHEKHSADEWTAASDEEIANILLVISLAEGKLLEWTIRESAVSDGTLFRRDFYGPHYTGTPHDGIFHWLNLQPVLDLAVTKYTEVLRSTTGIELAIRLLLAQPGHVELQLITAMTASNISSAYTSRNSRSRHRYRSQYSPRSGPLSRRRTTRRQRNSQSTQNSLMVCSASRSASQT